MEDKTLEIIDEATNEIMDMIRDVFKQNEDSDKDDEMYGFIHTKINKIKERVEIPIYFYQEDGDGKIIIDEKSMTDEFNEKLEKLKKYPEKFLEVEKLYCINCNKYTRYFDKEKEEWICEECELEGQVC